MRSLVAVLFVFFASPLAAQRRNPHYTYWIDGPCGETIIGAPGDLWDDAGGGGPFFDANPPGQTWDVILTTADNEGEHGVVAWSVALGIDGPVRVTDVTLNGTAGCLGETLVPAFPECRRDCIGFAFAEITGPPGGTGPQTEENVGVVSGVVLNLGGDGSQLPLEGSEKVLKLRVLAEFPERGGEIVSARVVFATRTGSSDFTVVPSVRGPNGPNNTDGAVTLEEGNPPLTVVPCEIHLKASETSAFIRCDPNNDGRLNLGDAVWIFTELFRGGVVTRCPEAADCNDDGKRNLTDGIYGLRYLFTDGPPPPFPFPECGRNPKEVCPPGSTMCP